MSRRDTFCKEKACCTQRREWLSIVPDRWQYLVKRPYIFRRDPKMKCFHADWIWSRLTNSLTDCYSSSGFPCNRCFAVIDQWNSFQEIDLSFKRRWSTIWIISSEYLIFEKMFQNWRTGTRMTQKLYVSHSTICRTGHQSASSPTLSFKKTEIDKLIGVSLARCFRP